MINIESLKETMDSFRLAREGLVDVLVITHSVQKAIREHPKFEELTNPNRSWRIDNSICNLTGVACESYPTEKEAVRRTWQLMAEGHRVGLMTHPNGQYGEWSLPLDTLNNEWDMMIEDTSFPMQPRRSMIRHGF